MGKIEEIYAKSLFELAKEKKLEEEIYNDYKEFSNLLMNNDKLYELLKNPQIRKGEKKEMLNKILSSSSNIFRNYTNVLVDKKRESLLVSGFSNFEALFFDNSGKKKVIVKSASPLNEAQKEEIKKILSQKLNLEIILKEEVVDELIMGFQIYVDGKEIDLSLDGAFRRLKEKLKNINGVTK